MYLASNSIGDCISSAKIEVKKVQTLIDILNQDYPIDRKPETWELVCDYDRLAVFIEFMQECVFDINKYIEDALKMIDTKEKTINIIGHTKEGDVA